MFTGNYNFLLLRNILRNAFPPQQYITPIFQNFLITVYQHVTKLISSCFLQLINTPNVSPVLSDTQWNIFTFRWLKISFTHSSVWLFQSDNKKIKFSCQKVNQNSASVSCHPCPCMDSIDHIKGITWSLHQLHLWSPWFLSSPKRTSFLDLFPPQKKKLNLKWNCATVLVSFKSVRLNMQKQSTAKQTNKQTNSTRISHDCH